MLVKHSLPEIDSSLPANQWHLSEAGLLRCKPLAGRLVDYRPDVIVSSREPKAVETAQVVAAILSKHVETAANLHEHDRSNVGFLDVEQLDAFRLSQRLGLPSFVVQSLPELRLLTILEQIDLSQLDQGAR